MKIISNDDYFMVINGFNDKRSRIENNRLYYWCRISRILLKKVNQITYDNEFYILYLDNDKSVSLSESDDGFSKIYEILSSKFRLNEDVIKSVILGKVGDGGVIWAAGEDD